MNLYFSITRDVLLSCQVWTNEVREVVTWSKQEVQCRWTRWWLIIIDLYEKAQLLLFDRCQHGSTPLHHLHLRLHQLSRESDRSMWRLIDKCSVFYTTHLRVNITWCVFSFRNHRGVCLNTVVLPSDCYFKEYHSTSMVQVHKPWYYGGTMVNPGQYRGKF